MSSLGAKVKDILHSGDSQDAQRGEVDHKTPGAYPIDEPASTHEHNKLHKPNDPRGWSSDDKTSRGHAYKDSGVGLEDSRGQSSYDPSHQTISEKPRDTLAEPYQSTSQRSSEPYERTTERSSEPLTSGLGDSSNLTSQQEPSDITGTGTESSSQKHPYWGDLPSGGVHNTVIGHGSPEDEARRSQGSGDFSSGQRDTQQTTSSRAKDALPIVGSTSSRQDPLQPTGLSSQRDAQQLPGESTSGSRAQHALPIVGSTSSRQTPAETTGLSSSQRDTRIPQESTSTSHRNEALAGAAGVGAAGAGAYALNKRREDERTERADPATQTQTQTQPEEHHKGRSFPLLGHKDKDKEHHTKEHKEDKKVKEEKKKEPKPEKESKLGALFHRSHKDKDETKTDPTQDELAKEKEKDKHHKTRGALAAGAGAGAAATYAATRDRDDERQPRDETTSSRYQQDPTRGTEHYQSTGQYSGTGQQSGTTQQPLGSQYSAGQISGGQHSSTGQHSGLGTTGAYGSQGTQPTERSIQDTTTQSRQPESSHGHRDAKLATGAAAGLGAGALASHELGNRNRDKESQYTTQDTSRQSQPQTGAIGTTGSQSQYTTQDSSRQFQPGQTGGLGTTGFQNNQSQYTGGDSSRQFQPGQTGAIGTSGTHHAVGHGSSRTDPFSSSDKSTQGHSTGEVPSVTQLANEGKYNTLSSGTPSGVRTDDFETSRPTQTQPVTTSGDKDKDRHYGAGAAGLGAAAGLGTAAAMSRDKDDKRDRPLEKDQAVTSKTEPEERKLERGLGAGGLAGTGLSKPVIHKCQKCGEDNDISSYFTSDKYGRK